MKESRVLITGATGFVGQHLAASFLKQGREVHLLVRANSSGRRLRELPPNFTVHKHDGTTESMLRIMERAAPDTVFHLASMFLAQHAPHDLEPLIRSNILPGVQLVEAICKSGIPRFINTGTAWQHYNGDDYNPVCLYAATKEAFEKLLCFYIEAYSLQSITLKLFDTYGPEDPRKKLFALFRQAAANGKPIEMSPGMQKINLVYIDDVVAAFHQAEKLLNLENCKGRTYAVRSGKSLTLRDLASLYQKILGKKIPIQWGMRPYRDREMFEPWQGLSLPNWKPKIDLKMGIKLMEGLA